MWSQIAYNMSMLQCRFCSWLHFALAPYPHAVIYTRMAVHDHELSTLDIYLLEVTDGVIASKTKYLLSLPSVVNCFKVSVFSFSHHLIVGVERLYCIYTRLHTKQGVIRTSTLQTCMCLWIVSSLTETFWLKLSFHYCFGKCMSLIGCRLRKLEWLYFNNFGVLER